MLKVASVNGFAFMCHPCISPMVRENEKPKENYKAIYIGYVLATIVYLVVGVLGALSIYGRIPPMEKA